MNTRSLDIALKEWDVVRDALRTGRQIVLLRKGGIADNGGQFAPEHERFLIFPTFVHQDYKMLKPEVHSRFQPHAKEPDQIHLDTAAEVTDVVPLTSRAQMDALDDDHIWSAPLIDMRFQYKPEKPLYLLIVRAYGLRRSVRIANSPAYSGCKSWVPLAGSVQCADAEPVVDDKTFSQRRDRILSAVR